MVVGFAKDASRKDLPITAGRAGTRWSSPLKILWALARPFPGG